MKALYTHTYTDLRNWYVIITIQHIRLYVLAYQWLTIADWVLDRRAIEVT